MSANTYTTMVYRLYDEVFNRGILTAADDLLTTEYVGYDPPHVPIPLGCGPQSMKEGAARFRAAFPDCRFTVEKVLVDGNTVAAQVVMQGTHTGAFMNIPPSNRVVTIAGMVIYSFADGKIVESQGLWDMLGLLHQLGRLPEGLF